MAARNLHFAAQTITPSSSISRNSTLELVATSGCRVGANIWRCTFSRQFQRAHERIHRCFLRVCCHHLAHGHDRLCANSTCCRCHWLMPHRWTCKLWWAASATRHPMMPWPKTRTRARCCFAAAQRVHDELLSAAGTAVLCHGVNLHLTYIIHSRDSTAVTALALSRAVQRPTLLCSVRVCQRRLRWGDNSINV